MKLVISLSAGTSKSEAIQKQMERIDLRIDKLVADRNALMSEYQLALKAEGKRTVSGNGRITIYDVETQAVGTGKDKVYEVTKIKKTGYKFFTNHKGVHVRDKDGKNPRFSSAELKTLPAKFDSLPKVGDRFKTLRNVVLRAARIY